MKRILIPTCVLAIAIFVAIGAHAQQPSIASNGIRNGASYALSGLPNAAIAQGSIFSVFGQNLGPASPVKVSSFPLPTSPPGLAGTSVKVTVGGTTVDAIMHFTSPGQVNAVMPSNTPVGSGTVTVTYNNQTSNSAPVTVIRNSFGIFTLNQGGSGPGIIQNYNSATDIPFNTITEAVQPGQVVILWGTGLGPISGNETLAPPQVNMTDVPARVLVGGREAVIQYRGRSGDVGVDQVNFVVPQGITGCYVPVAIQIGNVVSNYASMAISSAGRVCSDPYGYPSADLEAAKQRGTFRLGAVGLARIITHLEGVEFTTDTGGASFMRWDDFNRFLRFQGGQSGAITLPLGVCTVYSYREGGSQIDPANGTGMDAGSAINISGPRGNRQLTQKLPATFPGIYGGILSDPLNPFTGAYLEPGSYSINNGSGGSDVGPFQVSQTLPQTLQWLNESSITAVNRAQGVQVTWSAADPNGVVQIQGVATDLSNTVTGGFICLERASANSFTVPSAVLLALPSTGGSAEKGALFVGSSTIATRFTASGLDYGAMSTTVLIFKQVAYQ